MTPDTVRTRDISRQQRIALAITAAGGLYRLAIAFMPIEWLLRHVVPDDAFYYFGIARNLVANGTPSFDGMAATNGFHPLWMGMLLPIFSLFGDALTATHAALALCALIDTATVYLLYRFAKELEIGERWALLLAAMYAFSPALLNAGGPMNGMETSINVLVTLLVVRTFVRALDNAPRLRAAVSFGALAGLAFLARTDNAILLAVLFGALVFRMPGSPRVRINNLAVSAAVAGAIVAPWLLWCWLRFGSPVQVSGRSFALVARGMFADLGWGFSDYAVQFLKNLADLFRYTPFPFLFTSKASIPFFIMLAVLAGLLLWWKRTHPKEASREPSHHIRTFAITIAAGIVLFFLAHTVRTIFMRVWYYYAFVPPILLILGWCADRVLPHSIIKARPRTIAAVAALALLYGVGTYNALGVASRDGDKYVVVQHLNAVMPAGTRIGAWNAGIYGYFYTRGMVINLDGVVNNDAAAAIEARRLGYYADSIGVEYLADDVSSMRVIAPYWGGGSPRNGEALYARTIAGGADTTVIVRLAPPPR